MTTPTKTTKTTKDLVSTKPTKPTMPGGNHLAPSWVIDSIFYQIFPDRFANGDPSLNPPGMRSWNAKPTRSSFHGGDLRGIEQHIDYLLDLGVNAIYLNPIFHAGTNHRYDAIDYQLVDPRLGDLAAFRKFIAAAKRNNIRVILDGVLNHCSRKFFAFADILKNGERSEYKDWFTIYHFPVRAFGRKPATDYAAWWNVRELPKLNTDSPKVRDYLFRMTKFWLDQGIDGWRLDVPHEIGFPFWKEWSALVKRANPDAYLVGEMWSMDPTWVNGQYFDGLMNYPLLKFILQALGAKLENTASMDRQLGDLQFSKGIEKVMHAYPYESDLAMYNLLGSHDTRRILTTLRGSIAKTKLAYAFLFAFPGVPAIYYGDEIGMRGGAEPASRGTFRWNQTEWNTDLRERIKTLIRLRKQHSALRRGDFKVLPTINGVYAFARSFEKQKIAAIFNFSQEARTQSISAADLGATTNQIVSELITEKNLKFENNQLRLVLPAWSAMWLVKPENS